MQKKRGGLQLGRLYGSPHFVFLIVLLLCGGLAGSLTGIRAAQQEQATALWQLTLPENMGWLTVCSVLSALAWQCAVLLAGWMRISTLFVGAVVATRGFSLAFAQGALLQQQGWHGVLFAFCTSGASALVCLPCLLLTGAAVLQASQLCTVGRGYLYTLGRDRGILLWCMGMSVAGGLLRLPAVWLLRLWM